VARYLREHGYTVLTANYRCRFGEIDIIAEDETYICFVEVKTRGEGMRYAPADAVDARKRQRILTTAELYLAQNPSKKQPRLDVAEVFTKNGQVAKIHYIRNAYDGEGK
jgi:putative endonuclease